MTSAIRPLRGRIGLIACFVSLGVWPVQGRVWRVPADVPTIQAGLDSLQSTDTLFVDQGVFREALHAPPFVFTLMGPNTIPDSRPIIDPTEIPGSDSLSCMRFDSGAQATIENVKFVNHAEMLIGRSPSFMTPGGIFVSSGMIRLRNCRFDSTYIGLTSRAGNVLLENSAFISNAYIAVHANPSQVMAAGCYFSGYGDGVRALLYAGSESEFRDCMVERSDMGPAMHFGVRGVLLENCRIGPTGPSAFSPMEIVSQSGCVIRNCEFIQCSYGSSLLQVAIDCENAEPEPIRIEGCHFELNSGTLDNGPGLCELSCMGSGSAYFGALSGNLFVNNTGNDHFQANVLYTGGPLRLDSNRFVGSEPPDVPDVYYAGVDASALTARENLFEPMGMAVFSNGRVVDAQWNWWGHESGPHHDLNNPDGQGGEVGDAVLFEPWYTDTSFVDTPVRSRPSVASNALRVFPNPFNAGIELRLEVISPGVYAVELFDVLGRKVDDVWMGSVQAVQEIHYSGASLSSGSYFVRAREVSMSAGTVLEKIVLIR